MAEESSKHNHDNNRLTRKEFMIMFYIKEQLTENATVEIDLTGEVFTHCPDCGVEQEIDLVDLIRGCPDFDFYGMHICCKNCTEKRRTAREQA